MADYLPLHISDIIDRTNPETGEIRKTAVCRTVQPEQLSLNLSRLDAAGLQKFIDNKGSILMVPVRRGEINGRFFTAVVPDQHIFRDPDVIAKFELSDVSRPSPVATVTVSNSEPEKPAESPLSGGKGLFNKTT